MSQGQEIANTAEPFIREHGLFAQILFLWVMGAAGRALVSREPFDKRKFLGEVLFAIIGANIMWGFGLMQGMSAPQMMFFGGLSAWGGLRSVQWMIKALNLGRSLVNSLPPADYDK